MVAGYNSFAKPNLPARSDATVVTMTTGTVKTNKCLMTTGPQSLQSNFIRFRGDPNNQSNQIQVDQTTRNHQGILSHSPMYVTTIKNDGQLQQHHNPSPRYSSVITASQIANTSMMMTSPNNVTSSGNQHKLPRTSSYHEIANMGTSPSPCPSYYPQSPMVRPMTPGSPHIMMRGTPRPMSPAPGSLMRATPSPVDGSRTPFYSVGYHTPQTDKSNFEANEIVSSSSSPANQRTTTKSKHRLVSFDQTTNMWMTSSRSNDIRPPPPYPSQSPVMTQQTQITATSFSPAYPNQILGARVSSDSLCPRYYIPSAPTGTVTLPTGIRVRQLQPGVSTGIPQSLQQSQMVNSVTMVNTVAMDRFANIKQEVACSEHLQQSTIHTGGFIELRHSKQGVDASTRREQILKAGQVVPVTMPISTPQQSRIPSVTNTTVTSPRSVVTSQESNEAESSKEPVATTTRATTIAISSVKIEPSDGPILMTTTCVDTKTSTAVSRADDVTNKIDGVVVTTDECKDDEKKAEVDSIKEEKSEMKVDEDQKEVADDVEKKPKTPEDNKSEEVKSKESNEKELEEKVESVKIEETSSVAIVTSIENKPITITTTNTSTSVSCNNIKDIVTTTAATFAYGHASPAITGPIAVVTSKVSKPAFATKQLCGGGPIRPVVANPSPVIQIPLTGTSAIIPRHPNLQTQRITTTLPPNPSTIYPLNTNSIATAPMKPKTLLVKEQPLLLQDLLDQEKKEQERARQERMNQQQVVMQQQQHQKKKHSNSVTTTRQ